MPLPCQRPADLHAALVGIHPVRHVEAEFVEAQAAAEQQASVQQAEALLHVAGSVGHVRVGARGDAGGIAAVARIQADVDLVVVEIGAG